MLKKAIMPVVWVITYGLIGADLATSWVNATPVSTPSTIIVIVILAVIINENVTRLVDALLDS